MSINLKTARFHQNISQWELSRRTGIRQSDISLFENGYKAPKDEEKEKIADALNCSIEDVFGCQCDRGGECRGDCCHE